jgi:type IV pilus assembly protein PilX
MVQQSQSGMSLVISLVFLVILAMIGVTVMNVSTLEEKMAAGTRDKDLAFQAAEMAIRRAEQRIEANITGAIGFASDCTNALCTEPATNTTSMRWSNPNFCSTGNDIWQCNKSSEVDISAVAGSGTFKRNPRYFIELVREVNSEEPLMMGNVGDQPVSQRVMIYRITAVGYGGSNESKVLLQSTYGKRI